MNKFRNKVKEKMKKREFLLPGYKLIDLFNPYYIDRKSIYEFLKRCSLKYNREGMKIIDLGCGKKPYESLFENTNFIGVDIEDSGHSNKDKKADIFYDGTTLPFKDNSVDGIISTQVFEHIFNIEGIIEECSRVLKPSGIMMITAPLCYEEHEIPYDFWRFTQYSLEKILTKNSFQIISNEKSVNYNNTIRFLNCLKVVDKWKKKKNFFNFIIYTITIILSNLLFMKTNSNSIKDDVFSINIFIVVQKKIT